MSANTQSQTRRRGDALCVHISPPHLFHDNPHRNLSIRTEPGRPSTRPLPRPPRPPNTGDSAPVRHVPRRRASGGAFVNHALAPAKKTQVFFVCNPSDSPISPGPDTPKFPSSFPSPLLQPGLPINIIPATPLPPYTPGLVQSHRNLSPSKLDSPTPDPSSPNTMPQVRTTKMHRRFGASVGSIPASALEDLRSLGEGHGFSRANTLPVAAAESDDSDDSDSSSSEDEDEAYSWVVEEATRTHITHITRPDNRISLAWTEDFGEDRWIIDRYSTILRAL